MTHMGDGQSLDENPVGSEKGIAESCGKDRQLRVRQ